MSHPEERCELCGGPNLPSWSVATPLWNAALAAEVIACPGCFVDAYVMATGQSPHWVLAPEAAP